MAKKSATTEVCNAPMTLETHPFYGMSLDDSQVAFRNALWEPNNKFVGVEACAGSGKTTIAIAVACLLYHYNRTDGIIYIRIPVSEDRRLGFLPGSLSEKTRYYMQPLYNTLIKLGENPYTAVNDDSMVNQKNGTGFITATTDVYLRGDDFERRVVIIDEAQNATEDQLRTIITRCQDSCLCVLIGSSRQIDLADKKTSGFVRCLRHFEDKPWAKILTLTKNYRGELSAHADLPWID